MLSPDSGNSGIILLFFQISLFHFFFFFANLLNGCPNRRQLHLTLASVFNLLPCAASVEADEGNLNMGGLCACS